jgi:hypothetical protein
LEGEVVHSRKAGSGAAENVAQREGLKSPLENQPKNTIKKGGRKTGRKTKPYGSLERDVVHLEKGGSGPAEDIASRKRELEGAAHEEAPEDAAVHVALLRLAQERVLQTRVAYQHAGRQGFRGLEGLASLRGSGIPEGADCVSLCDQEWMRLSRHVSRVGILGQKELKRV